MGNERLVLGIILSVYLLFLCLWRRIWFFRRRKSRTKSSNTYELLQSVKGYKKILVNCTLPTQNHGSITLDYVMLHESGVYVVQEKQEQGWILGKENGKEWMVSKTQPGTGKPEGRRFPNPVRENQIRLKWLQFYLWNTWGVNFFSYVIFPDSSRLGGIRLPEQGVHQVLHRQEVRRFVEANWFGYGACLQQEDIEKIYRQLYPYTQTKQTKTWQQGRR